MPDLSFDVFRKPTTHEPKLTSTFWQHLPVGNGVCLSLFFIHNLDKNIFFMSCWLLKHVQLSNDTFLSS